MNKKIKGFLVILFLLIFSYGCTSAKTPEQKPEEVMANLPEEQAENKPEVRKEFPSPDRKYTIYVLAQQGLYIGPGNDFENAEKIETGPRSYSNISWSPNSAYFFAGNDTEGIIMRHQDSYSVSVISGYVAGPFWAPEGDKVGFTVKNRVWGDGISEDTMDVLVEKLDNGTLGGVRLAAGTLSYYYKMDAWDEDGTIRYSKFSKTDDRLLEQLSTEFAHQLFLIDMENQAKKELALIKDLEYLYFNPSPDRKWLSMVKLTFSGGEAEGGIPFFYNMDNGQMFELREEYDTWSWNARWFGDSSRILLNEKTVYDLENQKKTAYDLPEDIYLLGGAPSPDGEKIAVLSCKRVHQTGSEGEPVTVSIFNPAGQKIKTINTRLVPFFSNNLQSPVPVNFTWLQDNQNLIVESWEQSSDRKASLWKISLTDGSVTQFAADGENPIVSPDGQKLLSFTSEYSDKKIMTGTTLYVRSLDGTVIHKLTIKENDSFGYPVQTLWDDTSGRIVFTADNFADGGRERTIVCWTLETGSIREIRVEPTTAPLYIRDGKIVCIDGYAYQ